MNPRATAGKAEVEPQSYSWEGRRTPELQLGRQKKKNPRVTAGKEEEGEP